MIFAIKGNYNNIKGGYNYETHIITDMLENTPKNEIDKTLEWKYFSKNISEVEFISNAWSSSTETEWQVTKVLITLP